MGGVLGVVDADGADRHTARQLDHGVQGVLAAERAHVERVLERCGWNQTAAARFLRIPRHTLIYRMEKYAINQQERKK